MTSFFVAGQPVPQGSARAFVHAGRAHITSTSGANLKHWRTAIQFVAQQHFTDLIAGPVQIDVEFVMPRPKSLAKKHLRPWSDKRPDIDKLIRSLLDALTGVVYGDDAQVAAIHATKGVAALYEQSGARITVSALAPRWHRAGTGDDGER